MATFVIACSGDHLGNVVPLGTADVPAGAPAPNVTGYLCGDCGPAYVDLVTRGARAPGHIPSRAEVAAHVVASGIPRVHP